MLLDNPQISEGTVIVNATVPSGTSFPSTPNAGELFYLTSGSVGLYSHDGSAWNLVGLAAALTAEVTRATAAEGTLTSNLSAEITRATTAEGTLTTNLTAEKNRATGAEGTLTSNLSAEITRATGVESNLQAQLTSAISVNNQQTSDIAALQSSASSSTSTTNTNLANHIADDSRHLTASENTLLDGITVASADVNVLSGASSFLGATTIASYLAGLNTNKLSINGSNAMTATLNLGGFRAINGADPVSASDLATKNYVDNFVQGLHWVGSVKAASTTTITLSGLQTIDGVALVAGDRVLVKDQTTQSQNGIWQAATGAWSRPSDAANPTELNNSAVFVLAGGATQGKSTWIQLNTITTVNTDALAYTAFSGPVINSAGPGISLGSGGQVSVNYGAGLTTSSNVLTTNVLSTGGIFLTTDGTTSSAAAGAQLAIAPVGTSGTYRSVSTNSRGQVVAGTNPTTIAGYGLTDAANTSGTNASGTWPISITGNAATATTATSETLATVTSRGATTTNFITVNSAASGNFITAYKIGSTYSDSLGAFLAKVDNSNGVQNYFYQGVTNGTTTFMVRADGLITNSTGIVTAGGLFSGNISITSNAQGIGSASALNVSGDITAARNGANNGVIYFGTSGSNYLYFDGTNYVLGGSTNLTSGSFTGAGTGLTGTAASLTAGNTQSIAGALAGSYTWTGTYNYFQSPANCTVGQNSQASGIMAYSNGGAAAMSFHRPGAYAINFGLDTDNVMRMGGWSDGTNIYRMTIDNAGNTVVRGQLTATQFNGSAAGLSGTAPISITGNAATATTATNAGLASQVTLASGRADATAYPVIWSPTGIQGQMYSCANVTITSSTGTLSASQLYSSGEVTAYSDERVKTDLHVIPNALGKLSQINGYTYTRTDDEHKGLRQAGVIAQEVEKILPEVVRTNEDGMKSVAYGNMVALLIEAVKELQAEVAELKKNR